MAGGAGFISNFLLWFESGYFDSAAASKPLLHLWTLGIEEQFYIIWPLLLWLLWKKRINLFIVSFVLAVISFGLNLYFCNTNPVADFYSPWTRFWELLAGAMLAWVASHPTQLSLKPGVFFHETSHNNTPDFYTRFFRYRHILSTAGLILLIAAIIFIQHNSSRNYPGFWAIFPVLATILLIAAGKDGWFNKWVLSNRVLVWFGLISYPLYLWHWPLLSVARIILLEEPPLWWQLASFPLAIMLAWLSTKYIENPLRFGKHGNTKTISLFVAMLIVGSVGLFSYMRDGFLSWHPVPIQSLETVKRLSYRTNAGYSYRCHAYPYLANPNSYKPNFSSCRLKIKDPLKPVMLLWGDSHAAGLTPGFLKYFGKQYNVIQRSAGRCPPVFSGAIHPNCLKNNQFIFSELARIKPQKVILMAYWFVPYNKDNYKKLETTIARLQANNINDIVVIGPLPQWKGYLPSLLSSEYMKSGQIPEFLEPHDYERLSKLDMELANLSEQWHVSYISSISLLCDQDRCITMASNDLASVMSYDDSHLTGKGSDYLASRLKDHPAFRWTPSHENNLFSPSKKVK